MFIIVQKLDVILSRLNEIKNEVQDLKGEQTGKIAAVDASTDEHRVMITVMVNETKVHLRETTEVFHLKVMPCPVKLFPCQLKLNVWLAPSMLSHLKAMSELVKSLPYRLKLNL